MAFVFVQFNWILCARNLLVKTHAQNNKSTINNNRKHQEQHNGIKHLIEFHSFAFNRICTEMWRNCVDSRNHIDWMCVAMLQQCFVRCVYVNHLLGVIKISNNRTMAILLFVKVNKTAFWQLLLSLLRQFVMESLDYVLNARKKSSVYTVISSMTFVGTRNLRVSGLVSIGQERCGFLVEKESKNNREWEIGNASTFRSAKDISYWWHHRNNTITVIDLIPKRLQVVYVFVCSWRNIEKKIEPKPHSTTNATSLYVNMCCGWKLPMTCTERSLALLAHRSLANSKYPFSCVRHRY